MTEAQARQLTTVLASSSLLAPMLRHWPDIGLPNGWLAAGAVAQTVWNVAHGYPLEANIRDVDLIYFDADDLSAESETRNETRIRGRLADLGVAVDVKNEARVHLWYPAKFGYSIAPYASAEEAIATFPTTSTAVGVRPCGPLLDICTPFGLDDLLGMAVRPNKAQITRAIYEAKVARWRLCWPELKIYAWDEQ